MKKNAKRFAGMLLVLAMLLSLSVTAFAADYATEPVFTSTATLNVVINGVNQPSIPLTVANNTSIYDAIQAAKVKNDFPTDLKPVEWKEVEEWNNPEVHHFALQSMGTYATTGVPAILDYTGLDMQYDYSNVTWYSGDLLGYGLVTMEDGQYVYIYSGYDWTYAVGTTEPTVYMDQYKLNGGETVTLTYSYSAMTWKTSTPIT